MSEAYGGFKAGKLKLKGEKGKKEKKKDKKRAKERDEERAERKKRKTEEQADREKHGGWWAAKDFSHVNGPVAFQLKGCYVRTLDDGSFTLGAPHGDGEGPDPEEVLLAIRVSDNKVAFKSGFEKYLKVDSKSGALLGVSEAVGPMEQFEPIFQEGKLAILGPNSRFLTLDEEKESIVFTQEKAGENEMVTLRSNSQREEDKKEAPPEEERGNVGQVELNYVKKFQKFQDHKIKLNQSDRSELLKAKQEGDMHEVMLDRRAKMKADRYCK